MENQTEVLITTTVITDELLGLKTIRHESVEILT
jgi:hypothetical protein